MALSPGQIFAHPSLEVLLPRFEECLRDVDDRPLGEANAPAQALGSTLFDYRRCPYQGDRRGGQMNIAALEPMSAAWGDILELLGWLRGIYLARYPVAMNPLLLARFAAFLTHFCGWLVRTGHCRWDAVPREASGLFKAGQGLYFTTNDMILKGGRDAMFQAITVDHFLDHTEQAGVFRIGDRVCAGPPEMVRQFVRCAIDGPSRADPPEGYDEVAPGIGSALDYADLRLKAQEAEMEMHAELDRDATALDPLRRHVARCRQLQRAIAPLLGQSSGEVTGESYLDLRGWFGTDMSVVGLVQLYGRERLIDVLS